MRRVEDLENRSKRNNIVIWGVEEGSEGAYTSMEEFISGAPAARRAAKRSPILISGKQRKPVN